MLTVVFGTPAITCPGDATIEYTVTSTSAQEAGVVETLSGPVTRSTSIEQIVRAAVRNRRVGGSPDVNPSQGGTS